MSVLLRKGLEEACFIKVDLIRVWHGIGVGLSVQGLIKIRRVRDSFMLVDVEESYAKYEATEAPPPRPSRRSRSRSLPPRRVRSRTRSPRRYRRSPSPSPGNERWDMGDEAGADRWEMT